MITDIVQALLAHERLSKLLPRRVYEHTDDDEIIIRKAPKIPPAKRTDPHLCRVCGTTNPEDFYQDRKSICRVCKNLEANALKKQRRKERANHE